ncbi:MAG TPA: sugar phosphate isomerase/epimerase [Chitinophagaceae bacterium]|nr:sugar phosphate isomerase/epimerase [Chitinophagaceae bacterium]
MNHTRKQFLQISSASLGALALSPLTKSFLLNDESPKLKTFGLQLYTIRDIFEKDPKDALKQISTFGYKQIEGYERAPGIFWGMKNTEFKKYVDGLGMNFISSHCEIDKDFEKKAGEAAAIGMKYLIYNWPYSQQPMDEYKKKAALFNKCGETCRKAGIRFAYHNYESSFQLVDGVYPHDVLMKETNSALVDHQMDIYWVITAGQDPETWFKKYPNRFKLCHIKDRVKGTTKREDTCDLGTGSIDFPRILKTAKTNGMQYYIAEQEHYPNSTPLKSAAADAEYMKKLKI